MTKLRSCGLKHRVTSREVKLTRNAEDYHVISSLVAEVIIVLFSTIKHITFNRISQYLKLSPTMPLSSLRQKNKLRFRLSLSNKLIQCRNHGR